MFEVQSETGSRAFERLPRAINVARREARETGWAVVAKVGRGFQGRALIVMTRRGGRVSEQYPTAA